MLGRNVRLLAVAIAVALVGAALLAVTSASKQKGPKKASAVLRDAAGTAVGRVEFRRGKKGKVRVMVDARSLSPGFHGFHVHTVGRCVASTDFSSAGGHWNPTGAVHGSHIGDLPPLLVGKDGTASARFEIDSFTVPDLLDDDGNAVIVHAGPDNLANIPPRYSSAEGPGPDAMTRATGDSGDRTLCGVVATKK